MGLHLHQGAVDIGAGAQRRGRLQDQYDVEAGQLFDRVSDSAEGVGAVVREFGRPHERHITAMRS